MKVMVWHVVQHGFFMGSRALTFMVSNGICTQCKGDIEDVAHLFFLYLHSRRWADLVRDLRGTRLDHFFDDAHPWTIIQKVIGRACQNVIPLFIFYEMAHTLWDERNKSQFQGMRVSTPIRVILANALFARKAFSEEIISPKKMERFRVGLDNLAEATNRLLKTPILLDDGRK